MTESQSHDQSSASSAQPAASASSSWLQRLVQVRDGERAVLCWSAAYFFFLLTSYYLLRPFREAMSIQSGPDKRTGGFDMIPWLVTSTMLAMLLANPVYAAVASRLPRRAFIPLVYRFFALNLIVFFVLFLTLAPALRAWIGYAYYVWLSVFNLFVVSIFWSFMADNFSSEQGKRLFGFIAVGGTLGAICGAAGTQFLVEGITLRSGEVIKVAPAALLLVAIVPLELSVQCVRRLMTLFEVLRASAVTSPENGERPLSSAAASHPEPSRNIWAGFALVAHSPYLLLICLYVLIFAMTSTMLYTQQNNMIKAAFSDEAGRVKAFANLDLWINLITLTVQVFLTARIIRWLGVGGTMAILPVITVLGFVALMVHPVLWVMWTVQITRRAVHLAVDRPAREVLYTVVGPDARYKSKSFIDTFIYRAGDFGGVWLPKLLANAGLAIGYVAVPLAFIWMAAGLTLGVMQRKRAAK